MSTITVTLPDEDLAFLESFSKARGISVEEILARQARSLREQLERPLPARIIAASGIIEGDLDAKGAWPEHLERKHR
jgi:hypothetical protein